MVKFSPFHVEVNDNLRNVIRSLQDASNNKEEGATLTDLVGKESLSIKELRFVQTAIKSANATAATSGTKTAIPWLHEVIEPNLFKLPQVLSTLTPEQIEEQNQRRKVLEARAAEREYQRMVAPLYKRSTREKRRSLYEQKLQYQLGVPLNMIAAAATSFLVGYYGGMHYYDNDHSAALGVGCICLFVMLFVEMMLFTIRSI